MIGLIIAGCENQKATIPIHDQYINIEKNIDLFVETFGNKKDEACIFISGAGANSSFWSDSLCLELANSGFFVIKYDHRDFGYSTKIEFEKNPYDVMQLAEDALTILDSLGINKAHVVGQSMGGFIVQLLAIHHQGRLLSMTSISASTSSPNVPQPPDETWELFMKNQPTNNFDKDLNGFMEVWKYLNGTARFDEELAIEYTKNLYLRQDIDGALGAGHVKAQANLTDRSELLKNVKMPALIMHGEEDYLVDKYGGIQTAECIENARLILIPKMGHIPFNREILEQFENEIVSFLSEHKVSP